MRKLLLLLPLCLLLIQCKNDPKPTDPTGDLGQNESKTPKSETGYFHLTGKIKDIPITMNLVRSHAVLTSTPEESFQYGGFYYYDKYMEPISISQLEEDTSGVIQLVEWSSDETTNQFVGKFDKNGDFSGEWQNGYRQFSLPFYVSENYQNGSVELDFYSWETFKPADPNKPDEEQISIGLSTVWPKDNNPFIKGEILKLINGTEVDMNIQDPKEVFDSNKKALIEDYDMMVQDYLADSIPVSNFSYDDDMNVIWNEDSLLVISFANYSYEGGAHGNFGKDHINLDLRAERKMVLEDIFLPGYENRISAALEKALRRKYELRPNDDIREIVDVDKIPITDNFFLSGGGIGFYYPPYELGPWAAGDFEFFVRYEDIEDLLKPEFLDRF
jgi:hypothetical protein